MLFRSEGKEVGGHKWHSPIRSGPDEVERFQRKTLAILNEHSLSITLRNLPARLVDFCWLWSLRQTPDFQTIDPPDEMAQLTVRRRILGISL